MKAKVAVVLAALVFAFGPGALIAQQISGGGGGTPGGSSAQFQYNNAGSFGGSAALLSNTGCNMFANCVVAGDGGTGQEFFVDGNIAGIGAIGSGNVNWIAEMAVQNVIVSNSGLNQCWGSQGLGGGSGGNLRTSKDSCLARNAAGVIEVNNGTAGSGGAALAFFEQTAPSAPAANGARLYAQDNGGGKTQLCALFSSGATQCFATQP